QRVLNASRHQRNNRARLASNSSRSKGVLNASRHQRNNRGLIGQTPQLTDWCSKPHGIKGTIAPQNNNDPAWADGGQRPKPSKEQSRASGQARIGHAPRAQRLTASKEQSRGVCCGGSHQQLGAQRLTASKEQSLVMSVPSIARVMCSTPHGIKGTIAI